VIRLLKQHPRMNFSYSVTTQHHDVKAPVTAQVALDLFENTENTRSVLLHSSMFDTVIGQIKGELSSYQWRKNVL